VTRNPGKGPQWSITCHARAEVPVIFMASWEHGECTKVACPENTFPNVGNTNCTCDGGFLGAMFWLPENETWAGECVEQPCAPMHIPHSSRAAGVGAACSGFTLENCYFKCDVGYRCDSAEADCHWHAAASYCDRDGFFQDAACVPAACPEFSKPVSPGDATLGCECIENYEPRDLRWERVDSGWSGVCEGEWVVAARARAALFEFIGVCAVLGTVLIGGGCGAKRLRVRQVPGTAHLP
jgi:hypothetical protein